MNIESWFLFVMVWSATTIPVGPNVINCVSVSTQQGLRASLWAIPGIGLAALIHIAIGLTGLATLLLTTPWLFDIIRYAGAGYMMYMAYNMWIDEGTNLSTKNASNVPSFQIFRQGFLISLSNPKAILINVAVFSQFIDTSSPLSEQLAILIPSALIIDALIYGTYCGIGSGLGRFLSKTKRQKFFSRTIGILYLFISFGFLTYDPSTNNQS